MTEKISKEDLDAVTKANTDLEQAKLFVRIAELEHKNIVLTIYNKYELKVGVDEIRSKDGEIVRKSLVTQTVPTEVNTNE